MEANFAASPLISAQRTKFRISSAFSPYTSLSLAQPLSSSRLCLTNSPDKAALCENARDLMSCAKRRGVYAVLAPLEEVGLVERKTRGGRTIFAHQEDTPLSSNAAFAPLPSSSALEEFDIAMDAFDLLLTKYRTPRLQRGSPLQAAGMTPSSTSTLSTASSTVLRGTVELESMARVIFPFPADP